MSDDLVARLRSPATVFYEYDADNGYLLDEAADEIDRLRAELAAGNARIMELERIEEVYRNRKPIVYSPDAQAMSDRVKAAEAERDALRALLREAREELDEIAETNDVMLLKRKKLRELLRVVVARIDAALKGDGKD